MRRAAFWLLLLLVFTVPWENLVRVNEVTMVSRAMGAVVAGVWLLAAAGAARIRRPGALLVLMTLFVAWTGASLLWTIDPVLSIDQVITYLQLLLLALIVWDLIESERELRLALQAYVLGSWVSVLMLIDTFLTGDVQRRFTIGEFNQNTLGLVLALALPMAWHLATSERKRLLRLANLLFIPAALFAIFLTSSRAALLGACLGLGYMALGLRHLRWPGRLATLAVAVALVVYGWRFIPEESLERFERTATELNQGDWNGRLPIWREGLRMIDQNWLVGVGVSAFTTGAVETASAPHNLVVSLLAELGLIGFALFASILGASLVLALRQPGAAAMWTTLLVVWFMNALTHNYEDKKITWLLFTLIAVSDAIRHVQRQPRPEPVLRPAVAGGQ